MCWRCLWEATSVMSLEEALEKRDELDEDFGSDLADASPQERKQALEADEKREQAKQAFLDALEKNPSLMMTTAGSSFEGWRVTEYRGTLSTDAVVGAAFPPRLTPSSPTSPTSVPFCSAARWNGPSGSPGTSFCSAPTKPGPTAFWPYATTCTCCRRDFSAPRSPGHGGGHRAAEPAEPSSEPRPLRCHRHRAPP